MSQTLSYNGYTHDPDSCWFTINRFGILGGINRLNKVRNVWTIHGRVNSAAGLSGTAAQNSVDTKVVAWENHVQDGGDLVFSLGSTMSLISRNCLEGTHVKEFSWLTGYDGVRGSGAEGLLRRSFKLVVYGDILVTSSTDITHYQDSLAAIGSGGAKVVPVGALTGTVQAQQVQAYTPYYAIQSGSAVGLTAWPTPPLPVYTGVSGVYYFPETLSVITKTPRNWGLNRNTGYEIQWNYKCWSSLQLTGQTPYGPLGNTNGYNPPPYPY